MRLNLYFLMALYSGVLLTGCMAGPNYHTPAAPNTHSYTHTPDNTKTVKTSGLPNSGKAQQLVTADVPAEWWELFHSAELNNLVRIGLANSPNVIAAEAALKQAQETLNASIGTALFPSVSAQLIGGRERGTTVSIPGISNSITNLYNPSINIAYTLDFFGAARRELESLRAQVDFSQFQLEAANLNLTSNIVTTAINSASLRAQIDATKEIIKLQSNQLRIVKQQFQLGGASGGDVFQQENQLAQTIATLPPLQQNLEQSLHALAVLVGSLPSEIDLPKFNLHKLYLPAKLPLTLPSTLAKQRPDIRAAEALLHSASAQIGVATANLYPQITLSGSYGWLSNTPNGLFSYRNVVWNYMGQVLQPIFNGGALMAKKRGAVDAFQQAAAQYRQTVIQAFQNVADTLTAIHNDAKLLQAQNNAEIAAEKSLKLTQQQYRLGGVNYINLLVAEQQYQQSKIASIRAQASRFTDTAGLFQALGGGWWSRDIKKCEG